MSQAAKFTLSQQTRPDAKVIWMGHYNADDCDAEDEIDGEHMAQIYSRDTF